MNFDWLKIDSTTTVYYLYSARIASFQAHKQSFMPKRGRPRSAALGSCTQLLALAVASVLLMLALADSLAIAWLVRFLRQYPSRFVAFYGPKAKTMLQLAEDLSDQLPEEWIQAWDFTVALVVLASVFHVIERLRVALVSKLVCEAHEREGPAMSPAIRTSSSVSA